MANDSGNGPRETNLFGAEFEQLCDDLASTTGQLDDLNAWPGEQFERLASAGVLGWVIPREYGGLKISAEELITGYERLARTCLVTTFVLTQRNGACQRIAGAENDDLKAELLPRLCAGETFATVGISHLTTSRQHLGQPAVRIEQCDSGFVFSGTVPWVTGAKFADYIVTGGTCDDGQQVLAVIPTDDDAVEVQTPPPLLALDGSQTGAVVLNAVEIDARYVIAGPVEQVMKRGKGGGTGSIMTSALALGTAANVLARLQMESEKRPDLVEIHEPLDAERSAISADLAAAARGETGDQSAAAMSESIRKRANSLVLRSTQAYLAATKGAGFAKGHPAERAVREAMFFLVWSCPQPVVHAALREFACLIEP